MIDIDFQNQLSPILSPGIRSLSDVTFTQRKDGSGTITLGPANRRLGMMQGVEWTGASQPPRLDMIPDVQEVNRIILNLQKRA
ncbi:MAG: hypothetical protein ACHQRM_08630 [Bacteroidia bacterium]